jgi:uncharacterized membrane protein YgcG
MSSRLVLTMAAGALIVGAAACAPVDPGFGETVEYAKAAQTINPDPVYGPDAAQPGDSGDKGAHAVKRYRTDSVKQVETMTTSSSSSGGGSGGGGGGPH